MNAPDTGFEQIETAAGDDNTVDGDGPDDEIIVAVRRGPDESARWRLQPEESSWQIAQIAEDLEDHLIGLVEADNQRKDNQ